MNLDESPDKDTPPEMNLGKQTILWYGFASFMFLLLTLTAGEIENFRYVIPEIAANPIVLVIALVMACACTLAIPLVHFGVFALFKSKRNKETFMYIVGGWSIVLGFLILLFLLSQLFS